MWRVAPRTQNCSFGSTWSAELGAQAWTATIAMETRSPGHKTPGLLAQHGGRRSGKTSSNTSSTVAPAHSPVVTSTPTVPAMGWR
jgi:hypothetical protein